MSFVHDGRDFLELLRIVAGTRKLPVGLVEKDYWVTHALWALQQSGLGIWFKGGTSLSKGFGLIQRFSEDLDLKIEAGGGLALPDVSSWRSESKSAIAARKAWFAALAANLSVPGCALELDEVASEAKWRNGALRVKYPVRHASDLGVMRPFVLLEVGDARVTPWVPRNMTSFVHDRLVEIGEIDAFEDNRPRGVRCVHPLVTLLEKLDAIRRRFDREPLEPASFVRHYEDAASVVAAEAALPALGEYADVGALANDMRAKKQIAAIPRADDPAFNPAATAAWDSIRAAHAAIEAMYWGPRTSLDDACAAIRTWIAGIDAQ